MYRTKKNVSRLLALALGVLAIASTPAFGQGVASPVSGAGHFSVNITGFVLVSLSDVSHGGASVALPVSLSLSNDGTNHYKSSGRQVSSVNVWANANARLTAPANGSTLIYLNGNKASAACPCSCAWAATGNTLVQIPSGTSSAVYTLNIDCSSPSLYSARPSITSGTYSGSTTITIQVV